MDSLNSALLVDPEELVEIYTTDDPDWAKTVCLCFENEPIQFICKDGGDGILFHVFVAQKDAARAKTIIELRTFYGNYAKVFMETYPYRRITFVEQVTDLWTWMVLGMALFLYKGPSVLFLLLFVFVGIPVLHVAIAYAYLLRLRRLGYEWPALVDANDVYWNCFPYARILPPAADVEMIPGGERTPRHLVQFTKALKEYRRLSKTRT